MTTQTTAGVRGPRLLHRWLTGWWHVAYLGMSMVVAVLSTLVFSLVLSGVLGAVGGLVGVVLVPPGLYAAALLGRLERSRIAGLLDTEILPPQAPEPAQWWQRWFLSPTRWKATAYAALQMLWGFLTSVVAVCWAGLGLAFVLVPLLPHARPRSGLHVLWFEVGTAAGSVVLVLAGLLLLLALPLVARMVTGVDLTLARWLIGQDPQQQVASLTQRVSDLTHSRTEAVDSVEAERRRIERDLHDGPQQRLVSIAMDLGMARELMATDPASAQSLLDNAHSSSKEAITEMRQVARGITPPILTDRGLDAALSALAARSPVPVQVTVHGIGRLDPTTEAIAYFCVSEGLTNIAKHSRASQARLDVGLQPLMTGTALAITLWDDGIGGADPAGGTGLTGLRQRIAAVDGILRVDSPAGGPTELHITLPLREGNH